VVDSAAPELFERYAESTTCAGLDRLDKLVSIPENYLLVTVAFPSPSAEEESWLKPDNTFMQTAQVCLTDGENMT
jgi:hypothetical protein